jgi:hypothetical protein
MRLTNEQCMANLAAVDHGVLCTTGARGSIDAVPICFVVVRKMVASPIDTVKAKDTTELGRLKNLEGDASATLLCEQWVRHDWSQLWWVKAHLTRRSPHDISAPLREECEQGLRNKYFQYRGSEFADLIVFNVKSVSGWAASEDPDAVRLAMSGDGSRTDY